MYSTPLNGRTADGLWDLPGVARVGLDRPSVARVYDALLGGSHNFGVDREFVDRLAALEPRVGEYAREYRAFVYRVVWFLAGCGVHQFLDLGAGAPTVGSVHEVARQVVPGARVVYVDSDPVTVELWRARLASDPYATVLHGDLRSPDAILEHPETRSVIDPEAPVGLLMTAVLHFLAEDPAVFVAGYRRRLAQGSFLAVSHACAPLGQAGARSEAVLAAFKDAGMPLTLRKPEEVADLLAGWGELVVPGLVAPGRWRPERGDGPPRAVPGVAGVARLGAPEPGRMRVGGGDE